MNLCLENAEMSLPITCCFWSKLIFQKVSGTLLLCYNYHLCMYDFTRANNINLSRVTCRWTKWNVCQNRIRERKYYIFLYIMLYVIYKSHLINRSAVCRNVLRHSWIRVCQIYLFEIFNLHFNHIITKNNSDLTSGATAFFGCEKEMYFYYNPITVMISRWFYVVCIRSCMRSSLCAGSYLQCTWVEVRGWSKTIQNAIHILISSLIEVY